MMSLDPPQSEIQRIVTIDSISKDIICANRSINLKACVEAAKKFALDDYTPSDYFGTRNQFIAAVCCARRGLGTTESANVCHPIDKKEAIAYFRLLNAGCNLSTTAALGIDEFIETGSKLDPTSYSLRFIAINHREKRPHSEELVGNYDEMQNSKLYRTFMDAPVGIALCHRDDRKLFSFTPCAMVALVPQGEIGTLMINEIQGFSYQERVSERLLERVTHQPALQGLRWRQYLVGQVEKQAKNLGFTAVGIQGAHNNAWPKLKAHLPIERFIKAYDCVAESRGYFKKDDGNYYKTL